MIFRITILLNEEVLPEYAVRLHNALVEEFGFPVVIEHLSTPSNSHHIGSLKNGARLVNRHSTPLLPSPNPSTAEKSIRINLSGVNKIEFLNKDEVILEPSLFKNNRGCRFPVLLHRFSKNEKTLDVEITGQIKEKIYLIKRGSYKLIPHSYSQSLETVLRETIFLLIQSVRSIKKEEEFPEMVITNVDEISHSPYVLILAHANSLLQLFRKRFEQLFIIEKWNIGKIDAAIHSVALNNGQQWKVSWMEECRGISYNADPFPAQLSGKEHLYYENLDHPKGRIFHIQSNTHAVPLSLNAGIHFSYPYTFSYNGKDYVLPEQSESNQLLLYPLNRETGSTDTPIVLLEQFAAVDPSIVHFNHTWWIFCTDRKEKGADIRLHIFYAKELNGPWLPHQNNPVLSSIFTARPAGHLFIHDGNLYRPSQDSSLGYGSRINIHRIDVLSVTDFRETLINRLEADQFNGPYTQGIHTLSGIENTCYIDGKRKYFHPFKVLLTKIKP